ncbi:MAG: FAD-dependent monooxygenase [Candidatus Korobacteraceae bacterium]|jgi:flavin-dependent dehydrogenase
MCETEVFVIGGGPAGLAAAIACRQAGFDVRVVDCATPPIDKTCGEGITPDGVAQLKRLGISLRPSAVARFEGIRFLDAAGQADARFPDGSGIGVRRTVLHQALIDRAADSGVAMHWGARISHLSNEIIIDGQKIRSRWLVCADGENSQLRKMAGLSRPWGRVRRRFGFRRHYRVAPWSEFVEVYWSDVGQMYVTPVSAEQVGVALLTRIAGLRFDEALPSFPALAGRLSGLEIATRTTGGITTTRRFKAVQRNRVALIGDASGSVDAITGQGLSLAFQQAIALAQAMRTDSLLSYQEAHRRIARIPRLMGGLMLAMDNHSGFRRRVFRAFNAEPDLFTRLRAFHAGATSPIEFGLRSTLSLGWQLLAA